ncbi:MAG: hypothetical protein ACYC96_10275 [Fimbriimonadaceae bacterium]
MELNALTGFFADSVPPPTFWNGAYGSGGLLLKIVIAFLVTAAILFLVKDAGPRVRKYLIGGTTFIAGAFYVAYFLYPTPLNRQSGEMPQNFREAISFWFDDAVPAVGQIANIMAAFLLGLGVYSVFTVHVKRVLKQSTDWGFSVVLLACVLLMVGVGYFDWFSVIGPGGQRLDDPANWTTVNYARNFLFDGMLQNMDAAMFSIISFFILSAAYRAFRIRSIEATILLGSAVIMMIGLLGGFESIWNQATHQSANSTFTMGEITKWLRDCFQTPSLRAIQFGLGIGTLAMGLRLWLSLEKQGAS